MILSGSVDVPNEPLSELLATLVPEVFLKPQEGREEVKSSHEAVRTANPLVTLDLNLTFKNADASCQMRQIDNYQGDQWQQRFFSSRCFGTCLHDFTALSQLKKSLWDQGNY